MDFHRDGERVRFCQRCGLAHPLADFDGQRRSCRKQLDKHNARRRKKEGATSKSASDRAASPSEPPSSRSHSGSPLPAKSEASGSSQARTHDERVLAAPGRPLSPLGSEGLTAVPNRCRQRATGSSLSLLDDSVGALPDNPLASSSSEGMVEELSAWISDCLSEDALCDGVVDGGAVAPFLLDEGDAWGDLGAYALRGLADADGALGRAPASQASASLASGLSAEDPAAAGADDLLLLPCASIKIFAATPADLPADLPERLRGWCSEAPEHVVGEEAYLRPGCLHLTLQASVQARHARPPAAALEALVARVGAWWAGSALVQVASTMVLIQAGMPVQRWTLRGPGEHRLVPGVLEVTPPVLSVQESADDASPTALRVRGVNLLQDGGEVLCRLQGSFAPTRVACADCACARRGAGDDAFEARCCGCCVARLAEAGQKTCCGARGRAREQSAVLELARPLAAPGVLHVSAQAGPYVSPAAACLVVETEAEAAELRAWLRATSEPTAAVLRALGAVNEYVGAPPGKLRRAAVLERAAARLVFWALRRGLAAVARGALHALARMVESATAASLAGAAPAARRPAPSGDGLSLLHAVPAATCLATLRLARALGAPRPGLSLVAAAVQSRDPAVLEQVLGWEGVVRMQLAEHAAAELTEALEAIAGEEAGDDDLVPEGGAARAPLTQSPCCASRAEQAPPIPPPSSACAEEMARLLRSAGLLSAGHGPHLRPPKAIGGARLRTRPGEPDSVVAPATPTRCACMGSCPCARRLAGSCCSGGPRGCGQGSGACPCCADAASAASALGPPCCSGSQGLRRVATTD